EIIENPTEYPEIHKILIALERTAHKPQASAIVVTELKASLYEILTQEFQASLAEQANSPPSIAEFLLTALATTRTAEAMIGDLNERFRDERKKFGRSRAIRLYWARALRSLWPLLWRAIGKAVKWGVVIAAMKRLF